MLRKCPAFALPSSCRIGLSFRNSVLCRASVGVIGVLSREHLRKEVARNAYAKFEKTPAKSILLAHLTPILEWRPLTSCQRCFLALLYYPNFQVRPADDPLASLDHFSQHGRWSTPQVKTLRLSTYRRAPTSPPFFLGGLAYLPGDYPPKQCAERCFPLRIRGRAVRKLGFLPGNVIFFA